MRNRGAGRRLWNAVRRAAVLLPLVLCLATRGARADQPGLRPIAERDLPTELEQARDVRWAGEDSLFLAVLRTGAVELFLDSAESRFQQLTPAGHGADGIGLTGRIAVSERYLTVASGLFLLGWKTRGGPVKFEGRESFEFIEDLDIFGDRLAVLGVRRADNGEMAPEGGIGWTGSLAHDLKDLKPMLYSAEGPGAKPLRRCGTFEVGAIRFFPDGSLVVVPGSEPGAFLFDADGKLIHTWETESLLDIRCDFDEDQGLVLSAQPFARWSWLNQFRTVEDVLPLPAGPGLVIRRVTEAGTRWQLTTLLRGKPAVTVELPIESPSPTAHLRGDVRGNHFVFLLSDSAIVLDPGPKRDAAAPTRLIFLENRN